MPYIKPDFIATGQGHLDCAQMRDWDIVVAADAPPSELYAAEEFRLWFGQATGGHPAIHTATNAESHRVNIGAALWPADHPPLDTGALGEEGFQILIEPERLVIAGGHPRGALYGVYQFLEDFLNVRFLTHDHTHVPDGSAVQIPCGTYTCTPPFSFRWSYYYENKEQPDFAARLRVNTVTEEERLGGKTRQNLINHTFHMLVPFDRHGVEHPEYYAMVDGKRDTDTHGGGPQLCVTNPEVIDIAADAAIDYLDHHPGLQNISVSQADTDRYCRCEACETVNRPEGSPMGAQLAFVNAVAERIERVYPEVKVGTLAYWYTRKAPATIRPRHNIQIQLCSIECCTLHPVDDGDCSKNREFCQDMSDWGKICDDIWIWNYNTNFRNYDLPFPNLRSIGPNVRYFLSNNTRGIFMQANGNGRTGELCDLRNYIIGRTLWSPDFDSRALTEEFIRLHYAEAAQPILDWVDLLHDNAEVKGVHPNCFPTAEEVGLDPTIARQALDYFAQAQKLAGSDTIRHRVEKASISAYKAMIVAGGPMDGAERAALIERYITLCRRHGMTRATEQKLAEDYFAELLSVNGER